MVILLKFIKAVVRYFQKALDVTGNEDIIPNWLFEQKLDFQHKNEEISRTFLNKVNEYAGNTYDFIIIWKEPYRSHVARQTLQSISSRIQHPLLHERC